MNGNTGALTHTASVCGSGISRSANLSPSASLAAILASGTPVALATKGNVREPRGFTSSTYRVSSRIAYWMLKQPLIPNSMPIRLVQSSTSVRICSEMFWGGMKQVESPE